jgi:DNA (cytosine-5)-methyltransferase 1
MMRVLDLFSGIGGFSLGLERTGGFRTVAFCEVDPFCRAVLAKHWPGVRCYEDIRGLDHHRFAADGLGRVDLVCGGFPCQDISVAGRGAGLDGARSGLWREMARLVGEFRPRWVLAENVPALRSRGGDRVCAELEALGYAWRAVVVGAVHAGAPHRRQRVWIVAHANGEPWDECAGAMEGRRSVVATVQGGAESVGAGAASGAHVGQPGGAGLAEREGAGGERPYAAAGGAGWWAAEPDVGRVAAGVPARVDRLRALGNAVVPQIPEILGRAILAFERAELGHEP